jgi:hypothetical protein
MLKAAVAVALLGVAIYLLVRLAQRAGEAVPPAARRPRRRRGPVAPDDDPRFLRELDEQVWREQRKRDRQRAADESPEPDSTDERPPTASGSDA